LELLVEAAAATVRFNTANSRIEARSGFNYPATTLAWTAGPVVILAIIAAFVFYKVSGIDNPAGVPIAQGAPPKGTIRIDGHQYYWEFTYPDGSTTQVVYNRGPGSLQLGHETGVVVDLAVVDDDDRAILIGHRLRSTGDVQDREAAVAELGKEHHGFARGVAGEVGHASCHRIRSISRKPTTRNATSNSPTHCTVCEIEPSTSFDGLLCPARPVICSEQAVNATAQPTDVTTTSRGPRNRLEMAMVRI